MTELTYSPPDQKRGDAHYATYHALWHLFEIGVVGDLATFASDGWDAAEQRRAEGGAPTRVALIDTSVAVRHPNLTEAIADDLTIDFFAARLGTFPTPEAGGSRLDALLAAAASPLAGAPVETLFAELIAHLPDEYAAAATADWARPGRVLPATRANFSAHGTALAGLIGARPRGPGEVDFVATERIELPGNQSLAPEDPGAAVGFAYAGVDPFCEIVPISTSFDPDPEQLILAMLYAHAIDADLVVLARDFADPLRSAITGRRDPDTGAIPADETAAIKAAYPASLTQDEIDLWTALHDLTVEMSKRRPIVCAAGNGGGDAMLYPACLAAADNGIVAVGARTATGRRAGYSTRSTAAADVTLYAPSGDGERLDRELQRLDTAHPGYRPGDHSQAYRDTLGVSHRGDGSSATPVTDATFAPQDIISTDVPGAAGYNGSAFTHSRTAEDEVLDYRSFYCQFSGTSAATAIAAGTLSLAMSAGRIAPGDGVTAKVRLRGGTGPTNDSAATPALSWSKI